MRYIVTPYPIKDGSINFKSILLTDDYSVSEFANGNLASNICEDFKNSDFRKAWKSNKAFVYSYSDLKPSKSPLLVLNV